MTGTISIDREADFKVLMFDDQEEFAESAKEILKEKGITQVDVVGDIGEATLALYRRAYDAVLADVWLEALGQPQKQTGDQWLVEHAERTRQSLKVLLTGQPEKIKIPWEELTQRRIKLVKKGGEEDDLYNELGELARQKQILTIQNELERLAPETSAHAGAGHVQSEVLRLFTDWAKSRSFRDDPIWFIGERQLTTMQLADEVEKQTKVGIGTLELFVRHLRAKMGLDR